MPFEVDTVASLRYVTILWPYLERNLRSNGGVVDKVLLLTHNRDTEAGAKGARHLLAQATKKYPGVVVRQPFCDEPFGCAFNEIMVDLHTVR